MIFSPAQHGFVKFTALTITGPEFLVTAENNNKASSGQWG